MANITTNRSAESIVSEIFSNLQLNINSESYSCRMVKEGRHQLRGTIFVKFYRYQDKIALMKVKKNLRSINKLKDILIFDVLGAETMELFTYAKNLQQYSFPIVFCLGGIVMAKSKKEDRPIVVKNKD